MMTAEEQSARFATLAPIQRLSGDSRPLLVRDAQGLQWVAKRCGDDDQVREELLADALYRAAGVVVPQSYAVQRESGLYRLSRYIVGTEVRNFARLTEQEKTMFRYTYRNGLAMDLLLNATDMPGPQGRNMLAAKEQGVAVRVDNARCLRYAAKDSPGWFPELVDFTRLQRCPAYAMIMAGDPCPALHHQLRASLFAVGPVFQELLELAPAEIRDTLTERWRMIHAYAAVKI